MGYLTIERFVSDADQFGTKENTPFAETPWQPSSEIIWAAGDNTAPIIRDGKTFQYFLEPAIVLELKEGLPSLQGHDLVNRVIAYAKNDA